MYIEVILPVPLADTYTYFVPSEMEAQLVLGSLVLVDFGKKRYSGLVFKINEMPPEDTSKIKPILSVESEGAILHDSQMRFWEWIAHYYLCRLGEVYKAVVPAKIREEKTKQPSRKRRKKKSDSEATTLPLNQLNPFQQEAYDSIRVHLVKKDVCLLHGVTSSGKTEIYTHLIADALRENKQVLYLLPEIALTTQLTERLKAFFGDKLAVYHSRVTPSEREKIWNNLLKSEGYQIVVGARSSVFLPFANLGLVIVDEEHEPSYKQQDPAPRYHARNAAIVLANMQKAKVVLGSATPSIESYYNAQIGKYAYVKLEKRFEETELPKITSVDVKELRRKKKMKTLFSPFLLEKMQEALDRGEQILLFQNRRGFAPNIACKICDWMPRCNSCDISLTYHKRFNRMTCHYCGQTYRIPTICPECGSEEIRPWGYGTEKVEEEIKALFPEIGVDRMDADTTRTKKSFEEILNRFSRGEARILIGTQMISKGLDFERVSLVGILNADALMNFPDFRAYERAYQLMSQVAGRAGRRKTQGEVVLQNSHPDHPLIQLVLKQNYEGLYALQMEERGLFKYPPLYRLISINLKHKNEVLLREISEKYARLLTEQLGVCVLGPDKPAVGRIQNLYIRKILLKLELNRSLAALRELLEHIHKQIAIQPEYRYLVVQYDVDPV